MKKHGAPAVAAAILCLRGGAMHVNEITDQVIASNLTTLGERGTTPHQSMGSMLRRACGRGERFNFRPTGRGFYELQDRERVALFPEVKAAIEAITSRAGGYTTEHTEGRQTIPQRAHESETRRATAQPNQEADSLGTIHPGAQETSKKGRLGFGAPVPPWEAVLAPKSSPGLLGIEQQKVDAPVAVHPETLGIGCRDHVGLGANHSPWEAGVAVKPKPGLLGIEQREYQEIALSDDLAWLRKGIGKLVKGGVYLLAGEPGIGKSTLALQTALDVGREGKRSLYVLTEWSTQDLNNRARLMTSQMPPDVRDRALGSLSPEESLYDIESLPSFLGHQVLNPTGKHHGVDFIVIDSVQGHGAAATATSKYRQVYEFCHQCKAAGITVVLVCHVTKRGDIAGPKDMEHNVDCVLVMRKAMIYRPLFVPKNRFGPAVLRPIPLQLDRNTTTLRLAKHSESVSSVARTYLGPDGELPEVQASVSLPSSYGTRGKITAPNLPRKEIEQIVNCINQMPDMDIEDLSYTIHCRLPGGRMFRPCLGLPLAMALIASYMQRDIPSTYVYLGEIDLLRNVRALPEQMLQDLTESVEANHFGSPVRLFLPQSGAEMLRGVTSKASVVPCAKLDDAVRETWPDVFRTE